MKLKNRKKGAKKTENKAPQNKKANIPINNICFLNYLNDSITAISGDYIE